MFLSIGSRMEGVMQVHHMAGVGESGLFLPVVEHSYKFEFVKVPTNSLDALYGLLCMFWDKAMISRTCR